MPWFPDFVIGVELARRQSTAAGQADPVMCYVNALSAGDVRSLETTWPGEVVVHDPYAGEVRGHKELRDFVKRSKKLLSERHARTETVATTAVGGRAVVELLTRLEVDGRDVAWPLAVVVETPDDRSAVFRTYGSVWPVDGHRQVRPAILAPSAAAPTDVVERHRQALAAGDADAVVRTFEPDGYYREAIGPHASHRGADALRSYFTDCFGAGGGIDLEPCLVTDDGVRCALEYNCVRWGNEALPPQAGIGIYERGADGLLAAARIYDDVQPPSAR